MRLLHHSLYFILLGLLWACKSQAEYTGKPAKSLINTENDLLEVNEVVFHENDSLSALYLEIKNENLLYKYTDTAQLPYARLKIRYQLFQDGKEKPILDSGNYLLYDRAEEEILSSKSIFSGFKLRSPFGNDYLLHLAVIDLNKKIQYTKDIAIHKKDRFNRQNFFVSKKGNIQFSNVFKAGDTVHVKLNSTLYFNLTQDFFSKDYPIALPPFSTKGETENLPAPDSSFVVPIEAGEFSLIMPQRGFYHLRLSAARQEGLSLFTFSSSFPGITDAGEMIYCTRYIMTKEEYTSCLESENKKKAIDKFWLEVGGSNERARELLKRYYARVKEANKLYTSYNEGWKTDRGMIFIVFGQPSSIAYKEGEEVWVYGSAVNQTSTTFIFKKVNNPYSSALYVLERSPFYKSSWSNAVDLWRQGIYYEGRK
ncbi:MAG: GWxTD domain-containing protein [Bacteroidia bacterium]|nr:GWxTD domain-containing protein [Bacteroidia bacterium]